MSSDNVDDGGDISSGFGESTVTGQVSDERAEQLLRGPRTSKDKGVFARDAAGNPLTEQDVASNEQDPLA